MIQGNNNQLPSVINAYPQKPNVKIPNSVINQNYLPVEQGWQSVVGEKDIGFVHVDPGFQLPPDNKDNVNIMS